METKIISHVSCNAFCRHILMVMEKLMHLVMAKFENGKQNSDGVAY